jgi:hypothetical protein
LKGGELMAGYKKVAAEDAEIFLKLYKKYLLLKVDEMRNILETLPTNVIERCFNGAEFFDVGFDISKLDESEFGFGGLHGYSKIVDVSNELNIYKKYDNEGKLDEIMQRYGFKVNRKKIGVLG